MQGLIVVDVQNEFSPRGLRPVPGHAAAIAAIRRRLAEARARGDLIAWVRHYNKPHESRAFVPGTWGSELSPEMDPQLDREEERVFEKDVYGAFTTTELEGWLRARGIVKVTVVGFMTHGCVSTTVREAIVRGLDVVVDPDATSAPAVAHPLLGSQTGDEVRRAALLQLADMGAAIERCPDPAAAAAPGARHAVTQPR